MFQSTKVDTPKAPSNRDVSNLKKKPVDNNKQGHDWKDF
jgi:hypothetical protein